MKRSPTGRRCLSGPPMHFIGRDGKVRFPPRERPSNPNLIMPQISFTALEARIWSMMTNTERQKFLTGF